MQLNALTQEQLHTIPAFAECASAIVQPPFPAAPALNQRVQPLSVYRYQRLST